MTKASATVTKKATHKRTTVRAKAVRVASKTNKARADAPSLVATKPLKGREALALLKAVGIVTASGKLALAYS